MTSVADFIKLPKKDFHNNLDLGMRYPSYVAWAGFYVPDFPEDGSYVKADIRSTIKEYTQLRTGSEKDVQNLMSLSLSEAEADHIKEVFGTINFSLLKACDTPENFVSVIEKAIQKYGDQIKLNRILAMDTDLMDNEAIALASSLLGSRLFTGIYFYGEKILSDSIRFAPFLETAKDHNLMTGINAGTVESPEKLLKVLQTLTPKAVIQCERAARNNDILSYMKNNRISAIITPNPDSEGELFTPEIKAQFIRNFLEAGVETRIGTESILLFNKSISQMASDLCNTGLFSKEEMEQIITD